MRKFLPIIIIVAALAAGAYVGFVRARLRPTRVGPALVARFLDANLGNAIVFETPEKRVVVVDPGPEETADALAGYLRELGVRSLDVIVTAPAADHIGALQALVDSFDVKRVIHGGSAWEEPPRGPKGPVGELVLAAGDAIRLSPRVKLEVLSPAKEPAGATARPLVTRITFGRTRFLLMSDALIEDEAYLIRSGVDLTSTVLVVPRHGRHGSTSLELLSLVRPEYCIVLVGRGADRPSRTVIDRIKTENTGAEVYRTDRDGPVIMVSDGRSIQAGQ